MNENTVMIASPEIHNQGVFNVMSLPINDDYIAVSHAMLDLLKEGWRFSRLVKGKDNSLMPQDFFYIELTREWKC